MDISFFWSFSRVWLLVFCILPSKTAFKFLVLYIHFIYLHPRIRITYLDFLPNLAKYLMSWTMEPDRPGFQAQLHHLQMEIPQSSVKMSLSLSSLVYEMCIVSLNRMPVCKISIIFYLFLFFHEREG